MRFGAAGFILVLVSPLLMAAAPQAPAPAPDLELEVTCDPATHGIEAAAVLRLEGMGRDEPMFELGAGLEVLSVSMDGNEVPFQVAPPGKEHGPARVTAEFGKPRPGEHAYRIRYRGAVYDPPRVARFSREYIADQTQGTIQDEGIFLAPGSGWYPRVPGTAYRRFRLSVLLPTGWAAVAEGSRPSLQYGERGVRTVYEGRFPADGLHLAAGRWKRIERDHHGITVGVFVFPEDEKLAAPYLDAVERYLDMYSSWIGPYAYDRFSVVENFFPTGYGMPAFTLLGGSVMRLPFIIRSSLGHEVAHNWWGNGVFVDEKGGNWCEGLTTYVADYHYKELESPEAAAEYRRNVCRDYTNYVSDPSKDFPLAEFTERSTPATRAVGYGKTMMVFHMLRRRLGDAAFNRVLRAVYRDDLFRAASWSTWEQAFSREAGEDLGWYFRQWVTRPGAPKLTLGDVQLDPVITRKREKRWIVSGRLGQEGGTWRLRVPLVFRAGDRVERRTVDVDVSPATFRVELSFRPELLSVDPVQDVFRRLDPMEMPPVLSAVLGDAKALFVVDDAAAPALAAAYRDLAGTLTRTGEGKVVAASTVAAADLARRSVFLLGLPQGEAFRRLLDSLPAGVKLESGGYRVNDRSFREKGASVLAVGRHPDDPDLSVAVFAGRSPEAIRAAGRKLVHYGKYSYLAFVDGRNQAKGVAQVTGGPLVHRF